ncbi:PREDICTED: ARF GTPase-activating protein GIT1, partial [Calidris pugnax]|uniref:ARF GTPase-activating protein GIT1 n=1 Tax=Calidris pugnax TaxID=198806 RepID=UPI00071D6941
HPADPGWASINRGVLICDECCSVHRSLGRHISIVKHLRHSPWPATLLQMVHTLASNGANSIWEHSLLDPAQVQSGRRKANPQDKVHPTKSEFIRAKYQMLAFVHKLPCRDDDGVTAKDLSKQLHSSVRTGNLETCLRLLSLGAQANFFHPEKGTTPLHVAAKAGQILQAELLVVYGADPGAPDVNGRTPIDYARQAAQHELAERLVECQYELTDRLAFYLCGRKPDHKNGHYIIPQMADSPAPSERPEHGPPPGTAAPHRRDRQAFSMYEPGSALKPFGQPAEELLPRLLPFGAGEVEDEALYSMHIPASVYRMRKGPSASSVPFPPSSPLLSCPPDGARHMSKLDRHGSGTDSDYDNTQAGEVLISMEGKRFVELSKDEDFPHELDPLDGELDPGLPSTEDVILKTEQVTKNIQELLRAAQESKHDSFVPCSEKIHSAVTEMASLFPKKPALETVRSSLRLLNTSAYRLQSECRKTVPPEPGAAVDYQLLTQQVIQCAYDIAKAAKQLVTITTREKKQ